MPTYLAPGVFIEERSRGARPIAGVSTSTAAFVGVAERGPVGRATLIINFAEFTKRFGGPLLVSAGVQEHYLHYAVRNFFELGGTRCYVVRVAHYTNINNAATLAATPAGKAFDAQQLNGAVVAGVVNVAAISPGTWGANLQVEVISTSKFQVRLAENIAAGNFTSINLVPNTDVVPGSVLYLVHEVTGIASAVGAANDVTFTDPLMEAGAASVAQVAVGATAFTPDFSLMTTHAGAAVLDLNVANPPAAAVTLGSNANLVAGEAVHFALQEALVVVLSTEATTVGGNPALKVNLVGGPIALPNLPMNATQVYARDFAIRVRMGGAGGEILETHANLSLVPTNTKDYVDKLRDPDDGLSNFIVASDPSPAGAKDIVMRNTPFAALAGGNDGLVDLSVVDFEGSDVAKNGLHALDATYDFSILCVPACHIAPAALPNPLTNQSNLTKSTIAYVERRKDIFYIVDPPPTRGATVVTDVLNFRKPLASNYAALYFPWITLSEGVTVPPSGSVAGVFARSDAKRGVHKAPAGFDIGLVSTAAGIPYRVSKGDNDIIYPQQINAIRSFSEGIVVWGSRTIEAVDLLWQQVSIRRLFIFLEKSIELGTQWTVFEPNDPTLWKAIEKSVKSFLRIQWLDGKLVGADEEQAFFVRCNGETNPPEIVNAGMVVTEIGVAPSRPAEFVIFRIKQFAGLPG